MDVPHPDGIPPEDLLARADALRDGGAWADAAEIYAAYLRHNPEHWGPIRSALGPGRRRGPSPSSPIGASRKRRTGASFPASASSGSSTAA